MKVKKKLVLKPFVVPTLYAIFALIVVTSLFFTMKVEHEKDDLTYVNGVILNESVPVIKVEDKIVKPYVDAKETRIHNNANAIALNESMFLFEAKDIVDAFLKTKYVPDERFERRINKMLEYEDK